MRLMVDSSSMLPPRIMQGPFGRVALKATARPMAAHGHAEVHCIFKLGGSDAGFAVGGKRFLLDDSQAVLVNPWETHAKLASAGEPTLALALLLDAGWLADLACARFTPRRAFFRWPQARLTLDVRRKVVRLHEAMASDAAVTEAARLDTLRDLACSVVREYGNADAGGPAPLPEPMDGRIARALRAMHPNDDGVALPEIAAQVGLSRSRFFEQFRRCVGVSPQQYLRSRRMALATQRLADRGVAVAEVAGELGFTAPGHFTRFFEQHIGFTPREFQRGLVSA